MLTEFEDALRREFSRASRYRQPLSFLLLDLAPAADVMGRVRDQVRLCDSVLTGPEGKIGVLLPETALPGALLVANRLAVTLGPAPDTAAPVAIGASSYPSASVADGPALVSGAARAMADARTRGGGVRTSGSR